MIETIHITDKLRLKAIEIALGNKQIIGVMKKDGSIVYGVVLSIYDHMGVEGHKSPCWNVNIEVTSESRPFMAY